MAIDQYKLERLLEAERRGILPADKLERLNEARSRGLILQEESKEDEFKKRFQAAKERPFGDMDRAAKLAPIALGIAAAPATAGMSLPAAIATSGLVGGGVEAFRQLIDRARGRGGPDTPTEAAKQIGISALASAAPEAAIGGAIRGIKKALPFVAQIGAGQSAELVKKGIKSPGDIPVGIPLIKVESSVIESLRRIQNKAEVFRKQLGKA